MKHLNPRQGITTSQQTGVLTHRPSLCRCETPKSPPGDYNPLTERTPDTIRLPLARCETPKSPPGDYNHQFSHQFQVEDWVDCVKHLNPRQGITTSSNCPNGCYIGSWSVKHLNPRQGITINVSIRACEPRCFRVKHLNPRQGITTNGDGRNVEVKHVSV